MDELGTVGEVMDLLGVTRQGVHYLLDNDPDMPAPIVVKSNGKIQLWDMRQVRRFAKSKGYPKAPRAPKVQPTTEA